MTRERSTDPRRFLLRGGIVARSSSAVAVRCSSSSTGSSAGSSAIARGRGITTSGCSISRTPAIVGVLASGDELLDFFGVRAIPGNVPRLMTPMEVSDNGLGRFGGRYSDGVPIGSQEGDESIPRHYVLLSYKLAMEQIVWGQSIQ